MAPKDPSLVVVFPQEFSKKVKFHSENLLSHLFPSSPHSSLTRVKCLKFHPQQQKMSQFTSLLDKFISVIHQKKKFRLLLYPEHLQSPHTSGIINIIMSITQTTVFITCFLSTGMKMKVKSVF